MRGWRGVPVMAVGLALGACHEPVPTPSVGTGSSSSSGVASPGSTTSGGPVGGTSTTSSVDGTTAGSTTTPMLDLIVPTFDVGRGMEGNACSDDLMQVLDVRTGDVVATCPPDQGCSLGFCVPACSAAASADGSVGCEFIVPTSPFYGNGNPAIPQSGPCHALLVANPWSRPAQLELSRDGMPYDAALVGRIPMGIGAATVYAPLPPEGVPPGQVAVIFLAHRPGVVNGTSLECPVAPAVLEDTAAHGTDMGVAFEVHSDTPIQVYDIIPYGGGLTYLPSASLLVPTSAWGDAYVVLSPHFPEGDEWVLAVAALDDTTVSIRPTVVVTPGPIVVPPPAMVTDYTLDAGEVVQWQSVADPVGSVITSDKPIGVMTGDTYLRVNTADAPGSGRDSAHQMIPDVNALGTEYVGGGLFSRLPGFMPESVRYRIVGAVDDTVLQWDDQPPFAPGSLDAGESFDFESREFFSVRSLDDERPFALTQYMSGSLSGQPGCAGQVGPCSLGDDDWVTLVPPQQFLRSYAFFVDPTYGTSTLVFVREAGEEGFADVELACMGVVTGWESVGDAGRFEVAHVELYRGEVGAEPACETGQHFASSEGRFGVMVWGTDDQASYGYPAGGTLQSLNAVDLDPAG